MSAFLQFKKKKHQLHINEYMNPSENVTIQGLVLVNKMVEQDE
jgi:hypothetical protein